MIFKKINLILFLICTLLISCSSATNNNLIGNYEINRPILPVKLFKQYWYNGLVVGTELKLNSDSTFVHTNCSVIMKGKWSVKNDSLFFKITDKKWKIDSLNYSKKYKPILELGKKEGCFYKIRGKFLQCRYSNAYEELVKVK